MFKNLTYIEFQVLLQVSELAPALEFKHFLPLTRKILRDLNMIYSKDRVDAWLLNNRTHNGFTWKDTLSGADYEDLKEYMSDLSRL